MQSQLPLRLPKNKSIEFWGCIRQKDFSLLSSLLLLHRMLSGFVFAQQK